MPGKNPGRATGSLGLHVAPCVISVRTLPELLSHEPVLMGTEVDALLSHGDHPEDPGGHFLSFLKNSLENKQAQKATDPAGQNARPTTFQNPILRKTSFERAGEARAVTRRPSSGMQG